MAKYSALPRHVEPFKKPSLVGRWRYPVKVHEYNMWRAIRLLTEGTELYRDLAAYLKAEQKEYRKSLYCFEAPYAKRGYQHVLNIHDLAARGMFHPLVDIVSQQGYEPYFSFRSFEDGMARAEMCLLLDCPKDDAGPRFYAWDNMREACGVWYQIQG